MQFRDLKKQYEILKPQIDEAVLSVMGGGQYIGGDPVKELEAVLAEHIGVKHCITCANGTDAITIALRCFNVGPGDAVFIPDFTFFSTGECPAMEGAEVIFVDVKKDTYNMDPDALLAAVNRVKTEGRLNPKVVIAVDLFGQPADYYHIKQICRDNDMYLLEDAAQGFGGGVDLTGHDDYKMAASYGDISTTSFFPAKPLGCYGDGGAIFTDNDEWATLIRSIAVHGKDTENLDDPNAKYNNIRLGYNSRLDTIQAAILRVKLAAFRGERSVRSKIPEGAELLAVNVVSDWYDEALKDLTYKGVTLPVIEKNNLSSWAQYTIQLPDGADRDKIQKALKEAGVPTMVYYPKPMHSQQAFAMQPGIEKYDALCPVTTKLCKQVLSLPMHPFLTQDEVETVAAELKKALS